MGLAASGDPATSADNAGAEEEDAGNEDESIVHHTASVGDVEVYQVKFGLLKFERYCSSNWRNLV